MNRREMLTGSTTLAAGAVSNFESVSSTPIKIDKPVRVLTAETLRSDITAKELAQLMALSITYMDNAWDRMTPEQKALVERNSKPAAAQ